MLDEVLLIFIPMILTRTFINASVNLAYQKSSRQSSDSPDKPWTIASKAVDGCLSEQSYRSCCSQINQVQSEAWWQVDLGREYNIEKLIIHSGSETSKDQLQDYTIVLSNTSLWTNGNVCSTSTVFMSSLYIQEHRCPNIARYFTIYKGSKVQPMFLQLCEVQIYGCELGNYGHYNCFSNCPNCRDGNCHPSSGECKACKPKFYGTYCNRRCPSWCNRGICNIQSGQCEECVDGYYGDVCQHICSLYCNGGTCDKTNGFCNECVLGKYGRFCQQDCMENCQLCEQENGTCLECQNGYYGVNCAKPCSGCTNGCDKTGNCHNACPAGFTERRCGKDKNTLIVGSVAGVVFILAVVGLTVILYKRRSRRQRLDTVSASESFEVTVSKGIGCTELSLAESDDGTEFKIKDFIRMVECKSIDEFESEFENFPVGALYPHDEAIRADNVKKNRYRQGYPYNHSRVKLQKGLNLSETDYINANYIKSVGGEEVYIATQGPKSNTVEEFWRMVWQLQSGKIVMLTNLVEIGKVKCYKYWPTHGKPQTTATFDLILENVKEYAFFAIRSIRIVERQTSESRTVLMFHFTTWPDHGFPDPQELLQFHRRVISSETNLQGQMIVHCSAGIGRTGTFIALDALHSYGQENGVIDVQTYIRRMRLNRMNMVQTPVQYIGLHRALVECFSVPQNTLIARENFLSKLCGFTENLDRNNKTQLECEFESLMKLKPNYKSRDFKTALMEHNRDKHRTMSILAAEKFRVHLTSNSPGNTGYINAVFIPSYTSRLGFIVTQTPLPNTVEDFWLMICNYRITNIVVLDDIQNADWLPAIDGSLHTHNITIQPTEAGIVNHTSRVSTLCLSISDEESQQSSTIHLLVVNSPDLDTSHDVRKAILRSLYIVDQKRKPDDRPTVVLCQDGASWCGPFCLLSNVKQQLEMDNQLDIFQAARHLQIRRPQFLNRYEQYEMCYKVMGNFIENTFIYENL